MAREGSFSLPVFAFPCYKVVSLTGPWRETRRMEAGTWAGFGSAAATLVAIWAIAQQYLPFGLRSYFLIFTNKLVRLFYPYINITISEFSGERMKRSEAYTLIQAYLSTTMSDRAMKLRAESTKDSSNLDLSMGDHEEVTDEFKGATLWWTSGKTTPKTPSFSFHPVSEDRRYYTLEFHKSHRQLVVHYYLRHVMQKGKDITVTKRQRRLYTNVTSWNSYEFTRQPWSHVLFEHPANFQHIAMDPEKKREIIEDLEMFKENKDYYAKIGKPWKRGYLLFGPPGTGKSTMIAAMANLLDYDVYDLELTGVKDNTQLRKLLIETTGKSIIVIEDIDCSLDLTGQRKIKKETSVEDEKPEPLKDMTGNKEESKVTLSGLLNFIDGLWSACGGERLIVFTTNHIEKLDPALIRTGRMDMHIEMSHCSFEGFKILARNYLDLHSHRLFDVIRGLLEEAKMSPADVAEKLIPKSKPADEEQCLEKLIDALRATKEKDGGDGTERDVSAEDVGSIGSDGRKGKIA